MEQFNYPIDCGAIMQKHRALRRQLQEQPGLVEKKVALLSGSTIGQIKPILELFLLANGIRPTFWEGGYHLYYEDLVFGNEELKAFAPDIVYIHTSARNLEHLPSVTDTDAEAADKLAAEIARWQRVWDAAAALRCPVVFNNFEAPALRVLGNADAVLPQGMVYFTNKLNIAAAEYAAAHPGCHMQDLAWLAATYGRDNWCDESAWCLYKYALAPGNIPLLAQNLANIIKAVFGRNKKALALDLDNTLWGGVIGDDGPEGIHLGLEDAKGMAYTEFQKYVRQVSGTGVLLTVCSKNEEKIAREGFERAESVLKNDDFVNFQANWLPKDQNLQTIASQLNIGINDIVFVDDNPAERERVHASLPGVPAPAMTDPELYARILDRSGYFEVTGLSQDDKARNEMYKQNSQRAAAETQFADYTEYLHSLEMKAAILPFAEPLVARTTQLINKTNQFNLTTRRYTEDEVRAAMESSDCVTLTGRLVDKFGDNGLVSVIIGRRSAADAAVLDVELWVMSCRVFKRDLELAMFDALAAAAAKAGYTAIEGRWLRTAKNALVREFYTTLGFETLSASEDEAHFRLELASCTGPKNHVIQVNTAE